MIFVELTNNWMNPQTDKSSCDYRILNQNWSYQLTFAGHAIVIAIMMIKKDGVLDIIILEITRTAVKDTITGDLKAVLILIIMIIIIIMIDIIIVAATEFRY